MKKTTHFFLTTVAFLFSTVIMAQSTVTGTVIDAELNSPLPGANIVEKGTSNGISSDFDGNFTLTTGASSGEVVITYVGYSSITISFNGNTNLGTIKLAPDNSLDEIVITGTGVIDLAEDRNTPIAVSTIKAAEIQEKAGNWDLPEVLKSTPSVQNIKGGGFGDGSMFLRGFDQTNTAFMLNGQPINSPEDGRMFWSNWAGVLDVANAVQIQRGLGASKLAISSVGGTVNIVTKTVDRKEGGFLQQMIGNDNYTKTNIYYSTGLMENGWAFSGMFGHWQGDGYVDYTDGQGQTYFLSFGYKPNENNLFNFLITGAPQWHAAAGRGDIEDFLDNGRRYNSWNFDGVDSPNLLNGGKYPGGRNVYHKPVANLSWDWNINENSSLSTVLYGSLGRGTFAFTIDDDNDIPLYARGSNNNHNWYGLVSNFETQLNENLSLNFGADVRLYNGIHFRSVNEFLSVTSVEGDNDTNDNINVLTETFGGINPWDLTFNTNDDHTQRFGYDYEEQINYGGVFGQLEYSNDNFSAFFQGSVSTQSHVRTEFKEVQVAGQSEESEKVNNPGFNTKAGGAYTINQDHKVFVNVGYYSRQPFHSVLFVSDRNSNELVEPEIENEKITGLEAGYQFKSDKVSANVNAYYTIWDNRTDLQTEGNQGDNDFRLFQTQGVKQAHLGVELEVFTRPMDNLKVNGFLSVGDWTYDGDGLRRTFDEAGNEIESAATVNLDGVKIGGGAQLTAGLFADYEFLPRFSVDGTWNTYSNLYSQGAATVEEPSIELPAYDTVDVGLSYKWLLGKNDKNSLQFRVNINNVFDEVYIESLNENNPLSTDPTQNYKGVNIANQGRFGYGRTWNFSMRYNF
ncbi:TonB-dependent receptor [Flavivirga amylovorans]|uniref:TonB-dependent receptor n=1 Tax=Flavivirga amylovorans TaxID=870486 RepID=A0ABT8X2K2_9FLAO|nr:carboxypeptidase-like regulatory domain-containing protein [Flavivirga amylovorans]MDO5988189.1 TonB-dependent receptor [Flavivirga amylovorans]